MESRDFDESEDESETHERLMTPEEAKEFLKSVESKTSESCREFIREYNRSIESKSEKTRPQDEKHRGVRSMPKFREIDGPNHDDIEDIEKHFHKRPMTIEERDRLFEKLNGSQRDVTIYTPEVRGLALESYDHLKDVIRDEFPGVLKHRDIPYLMQQAKFHWATIEKFGERNKVTSIEISIFAKSIGAPESTVRAWITTGTFPRIYLLFEKSLSGSEGQLKAEEIRRRLGGVDSHEEFVDRMSHPYHERHTKIAPSFTSEYESARKFYRFLDELEDG